MAAHSVTLRRLSRSTANLSNLHLILDDSTISGSIGLSFGFRAEGAVLIREALVGEDLDMYRAQLSNPHNVALRAYFSSFDTVSLGDPTWGPFEADGLVELNATTLRSALVVQHSRFLGAAGDGHGFFAPDVKTPLLLWQRVELHNGAIVDLSSARVGLLLDDRESWPRPGNPLIDGLTYDNFGAGAPADARTRLQWISLESGGFRPQPYRQLAKVLADRGDDAGARRFGSRQRIYATRVVARSPVFGAVFSNGPSAMGIA